MGIMGHIWPIVTCVFMLWFNDHIARKAELSQDPGQEMAVLVFRIVVIILTIFDICYNL